ncbi:MAG: leucine-rich repeat protein [Eubacteriales bacterium]
MRKPIQFLTVLRASILLAATLISCSGETTDNLSDKDKTEKKTTSSAEEVVTTSSAEEVVKTPIEDFEWEMTDEGITITVYKGNAKEVVVPSIIENKMVTKVADSAFSGSPTVESIVMSEYLTDCKITFKNCPSLTYLEYPGIEEANLNYIYCDTVQTIVLPDAVSITMNNKSLSANCPNLTKLNMPSCEYLSVTTNPDFVNYDGYDSTAATSKLTEVVVSERLLTEAYIGYRIINGGLRTLLFIDPKYSDQCDSVPVPISEYTFYLHDIDRSYSHLYCIELFGQITITVNGKLYSYEPYLQNMEG